MGESKNAFWALTIQRPTDGPVIVRKPNPAAGQPSLCYVVTPTAETQGLVLPDQYKFILPDVVVEERIRSAVVTAVNVQWAYTKPIVEAEVVNGEFVPRLLPLPDGSIKQETVIRQIAWALFLRTILSPK